MVSASMADPARQVAAARRRTCRGGRRCRRSTSCSPRRAGATTTTASPTRAPASSTPCSRSRPDVVRVWLPPDANSTLSITDHCLRSTDHVNLIVVDKQAAPAVPRPSTRPTRHCAPGAGVWEWAGTEPRTARRPTSCSRAPVTCRPRRRWPRPSCCASTCPTCGSAFVNVVDLMALLPEDDHPHGYADSQFDDLFTADRHVVFAFHGYPRAVHQLVHGRSEPRPLPRARLHRAGHHDHPVRHGRAQPDEPLPPRQGGRCAAPRRPPRLAGR